MREWLSSPVTRLLRRRLDEMAADIRLHYMVCDSLTFPENKGRELQIGDVKELVENGLKESVLE